MIIHQPRNGEMIDIEEGRKSTQKHKTLQIKQILEICSEKCRTFRCFIGFKSKSSVLGSQNRKQESKTAVAKRQGSEKPAKIEQRKVKGRSEDWSEDLRQNKQPSWLAQLTRGRPRGRRNHRKRSQRLSHSLPYVPHQRPMLARLPHSLLFASSGRHALTPPGWIFLLFSK